MFTVNEVVQIIAGGLGTLGFGVLYNIRGKKLAIAVLGGALAWTMFILLGFVLKNEPVRYFIVSVLTSVYAEVFARVMKTPRTTFWMVCLITLVPGGSLYYTMTYALDGNMSAFAQKAMYTLELSAALSIGIVVVSTAAKLIGSMHCKHRKKITDTARSGNE